MARFYGLVQGRRGKASRLGDTKSGVRTVAASWSGAVEVLIFNRAGHDWVQVSLVPWGGKGTSRTIYDGPTSGEQTPGQDPNAEEEA